MGRDVVASFQPREGRFFLENERTARGEKMLAAAIETDRPRHQRVAALEVLAASPPWPDDDDENEPLVERLAPLLSDPDPWVRAAAIEAAASWLGNAEWKRAATRVLRPALERDAEVLIEGRGADSRGSGVSYPLLRHDRRRSRATSQSIRSVELTLGYRACRDSRRAVLRDSRRGARAADMPRCQRVGRAALTRPPRARAGNALHVHEPSPAHLERVAGGAHLPAARQSSLGDGGDVSGDGRDPVGARGSYVQLSTSGWRLLCESTW